MDIRKEISRSEMCSHVKCHRAGESDFHWHEKVEICRPINKPCRFLVDGKTVEAEPGDLVIIKEQAVHVFLVDNDDTDIRIIQFPFKILLHLDTPVKPLKTHIKMTEIEEIPQLRESLDKLFSLMDNEYVAEKVSENPYMQFLTVTMYMLLMRHFADDADFAVSKKDRKDFYRITAYINENFKNDINIKTVAKELYISKTQIAKLFERYSGMGLNEYISMLRIKNANQLMIEGMSITEAALESGFQSVRTFNNSYKEYMGMTPTEYIKKTLNQKRSKA